MTQVQCNRTDHHIENANARRVSVQVHNLTYSVGAPEQFAGLKHRPQRRLGYTHAPTPAWARAAVSKRYHAEPKSLLLTVSHPPLQVI